MQWLKFFVAKCNAISGVKYLLPFFLLLLLYENVFGGGQIGDWSAKTPGKNEINNFASLTLYLKNGEELSNLDSWYFYKGFIIGKSYHHSGNLDSTNYFVVNEITFQVKTFGSRGVWSSYIQQHRLKPFITRWFESDWTFFNSSLVLLLIFYFPISVPILILILILVYRALIKEKLNFYKPSTIMVSLISGLIFVIWLLNRFPQSIGF